MEPTKQQLQELFDYHLDGYLVWKKRPSEKSHRVNIGNIAGTIWKNKYVRITINLKKYESHRLIWIWHFGKINKKNIDHIDGNGLNNKIENLREATKSENAINHRIYKTNKSGMTGVRFCNERNNWFVYITINKKMKNLGRYKTFNEAVCARKNAEKIYFKQWARD